jgi:hypothetical protein
MKRKGISVALALLFTVALLLCTASSVFAEKPNRWMNIQIYAAFYDDVLGKHIVYALLTFNDIGAWGYSCSFETENGGVYNVSDSWNERRTSHAGAGYAFNASFNEDPGNWVQATCWLTRKNGKIIRRFPDDHYEPYPSYP